MQGLRVQESENFKSFFSLVQEEAKNNNSIFFPEFGGGKIQVLGEMECEDLYGWLIPIEKSEEFEKLFIAFSEEVEKYTDKYYAYADYSISNNLVEKIHLTYT